MVVKPFVFISGVNNFSTVLIVSFLQTRRGKGGREESLNFSLTSHYSAAQNRTTANAYAESNM